MSGYIFNNKGIRAGVENGASIFDLSGKKVYDLKGVNIYRLSGELVGHLIARGSDKRLDRDSGGLLPVRGRPELDKPKHRPGLQRPLSECFAGAIRLRQIIPDTVRSSQKRMIVQISGLHEHFPEASDKASARAACREVPIPNNRKRIYCSGDRVLVAAS